MKKLASREETDALINNNEMAVVYFTGFDCGACELIKEKVESMLKSYPGIESGEVNGETEVKLCADFNVFSLPVCIVFAKGKETFRVGRYVNLGDFEEDLARYYKMLF